MAGFHASESPGRLDKAACGLWKWDGSVGLAGLAGRPLESQEQVMWDGTIY